MDATNTTPAAAFIGPANMRTATPFDVEDLLTLGWVRWVDRGEENHYFILATGQVGFVKFA